jgi:hypothetical protein
MIDLLTLIHPSNILVMETRICSKCGETKNVIFFRKHSKRCKSCTNAYNKEYHKKNSENLSDVYVVKVLKNDSSLTAKDIREYPAFIQFKKEHIRLTRLIRGKNQKNGG